MDSDFSPWICDVINVWQLTNDYDALIVRIHQFTNQIFIIPFLQHDDYYFHVGNHLLLFFSGWPGIFEMNLCPKISRYLNDQTDNFAANGFNADLFFISFHLINCRLISYDHGIWLDYICPPLPHSIENETCSSYMGERNRTEPLMLIDQWSLMCVAWSCVAWQFDNVCDSVLFVY